MENFFSRPILGRNGVTHSYLIQGSWEELLQTCHWDHLVHFLQQVDVVWFSRHAYVYRYRFGGHNFGTGGRSPLFRASEEEGTVHHVHHIRLYTSGSGCIVCLASITPDEPTQVYQQLLQLLAQQTKEVSFMPGYRPQEDREAVQFSAFPISADTLSALATIGNKFALALSEFFLSEEQCWLLSLVCWKVRFHSCSFADEGRSLCETIGTNQGPMELTIHSCSVDAMFLHNAMCSTVGLRSLRLSLVPDVLPLVIRALAQNKTLMDFSIFVSDPVSEQELIEMFETLSKHPTLEKFSFSIHLRVQEAFDDETRTRCTNLVLSMLRKNRVLAELQLGGQVSRLLNTPFLLRKLAPYLQANLYRPRIDKLVTESEAKLQRHLFSRALERREVKRTPTLVYMLLTGFHALMPELHTGTKPKESDDASQATKPPSLALNDQVDTIACETNVMIDGGIES